MRIMRTTNEIEARVLHHIHVTEKSAVGHRVAPSRVILMHICAFEIKVFAIDEKSLVCRPLEPAETELRLKIVGHFFAVGNFAHRRVEKRMIGMPELRSEEH